MESSPSSSKRGKGVANNGQVAAHCLVDGCSADLSTCRDYHRRHKVCEVHSKTPKVTIAGREQRFCQQCSRFHSLVEFDEGKRSCRKRLDGHNRRRRKPQASEGVPPRSSQTRLVSFNTTPQIAAAATSLLGFHQQQQQQHCWSHNEMQQQQPQQPSYAYMETPTSLSAHFLQGISQPFVDPIGAAAAISHSDGALSLLSSPSATAAAATAADYAALAQYHHHHQTKPDVSSSASSTLHFPQEGSSHSHQTLSFMWE